MAANGAASWRGGGTWTRAALAASWVVTVAGHVGVIVLHARLDGMLDVPARQVREGASFHGPHETYLIATAVEWTAGLVYLLSALLAWRREDSAGSGTR
jgi:hypothetical protein